VLRATWWGVILRAVRPEGSKEALRSPFGLSPSGLRLWGDKKRPFANAQGDRREALRAIALRASALGRQKEALRWRSGRQKKRGSERQEKRASGRQKVKGLRATKRGEPSLCSKFEREKDF